LTERIELMPSRSEQSINVNPTPTANIGLSIVTICIDITDRASPA